MRLRLPARSSRGGGVQDWTRTAQSGWLVRSGLGRFLVVPEVSAQCSASWPDGSTHCGLELTVRTSTNNNNYYYYYYKRLSRNYKSHLSPLDRS